VEQDLGVRREDPTRASAVEEPGRHAAELLDDASSSRRTPKMTEVTSAPLSRYA
jgi:hypothetical protein